MNGPLISTVVVAASAVVLVVALVVLGFSAGGLIGIFAIAGAIVIAGFAAVVAKSVSDGRM